MTSTDYFWTMTARTIPCLVLSAAALLAASACASTRFDGPEGDRRFYEARCGVCHVAWPPSSHASERWPEIVGAMGPRAGLTPAQRERVLAWLCAR